MTDTDIPKPDRVTVRTDDGLIRADVTELIECGRPDDGARLGGTLGADDPEVHYVDYQHGGEQ